MHEYQMNSPDSTVRAGITNQVNDFNNHASYNVPGYIGEFNAFSNSTGTWQFATMSFTQAGLSWTPWAYKATQGLIPDNWGFYDPTYWPVTPNISTDSADTIAADWQQWTTTNSFALNTSLNLSGNVNGASVSTTSWFNVTNQNSGFCVDATGAGTANGTTVQQYGCGNQQANQEWQFQSEGDGIYKVVNRNASSEVWDVTNLGTANGSLLQLWSYGGGQNQQWMPVSVGNGFYKFVGVASGRCLDVPAASIANGVQLDIYDCNGTGAQSFELVAQP
jgi:hypothetical protein